MTEDVVVAQDVGMRVKAWPLIDPKRVICRALTCTPTPWIWSGISAIEMSSPTCGESRICTEAVIKATGESKKSTTTPIDANSEPCGASRYSETGSGTVCPSTVAMMEPSPTWEELGHVSAWNCSAEHCVAAAGSASSPGASEIVTSLGVSPSGDPNAASTVTPGLAPAWVVEADTEDERIVTVAPAGAATAAHTIIAAAAATAKRRRPPERCVRREAAPGTGVSERFGGA